MSQIHPTRIPFRAVLAALAFACVCFAPPLGGATPAAAQQVSIEFRTALDPHGQWRRSSRWGDVWIPARVERNWRPYTAGHWVYTDDWGWYWVTDKPEAKWGWVVYHYGRWVLDPELGWVWVPGREWGPAWVTWRRGHDHIGWAPLPPDPVVVEYRDTPDVWIFVRARDFTAPDVARVVIAGPRVDTYIRQTVVVNRTVVLRDRGSQVVVVNPGIEPQLVSAVVGQPLPTYRVRPRVLAGTSRVPNAVEVQASEAQQVQQAATTVSVQRTETTIEPAKDVPEPQPLAADSSGRLGENPPKAARAAAQQGEQLKQGEAAQTQPSKEEPGQAAQQQPDKKQSEQEGKAAQQEPAQEPKQQEDQAAKQDSEEKEKKQQSQAAEKKPDQKQEAQEKQKGQTADRERKTPERSAGQERKQEQDKEKGNSAQTEPKKPQDRAAERAREKAQDQKATQHRRNVERRGEAARKKAEERAGEAAQKQDAKRPAPSATTGQEPAQAQGSPQGREAPQAQPPKAAAPQRGGDGAAEAPAAKPQAPPQTDGRGGPAGRPDKKPD